MNNVLQVHLSATEKEVKKYIKGYNAQLKPTEAETVKAQTLKATHINTMMCIVKAYYKHLKEIDKVGIGTDGTMPAFKLNNVALAEMNGSAVSINKSTNARYSNTSWRHLIRLEQAKLIEKTAWHGTNSGYQIKITPAILIACPDFDFNNLLLVTAKSMLATEQLPQRVQDAIYSLTPSFSDFPSAAITTTCNHIVNRTLQELNINMTEGVAVSNNIINTNSEKRIGDYLLQEQQSINKGLFLKVEQFLSTQDSISPQKQADCPPPKKNIPTSTMKLMLQYVSMSWEFAHSVLYNNKNIFEPDIAASKNFIIQFYRNTAESQQPQFANLFNQFAERCLLARRYRNRDINHFIPNPALYFDPHFEFGFRGTRAWYEITKEQRKKNKEYNQHNKLLAYLFREYKTNPTLPVFMKHKQQLQKLKNKEPYEIYCSFIIDPENFDANSINKFQKTA